MLRTTTEFMQRKKKSFIGRILLPLLIVAGAIGVFAALKATAPRGADIEAKEKSWPVSVIPVVLGEWPRTLELYGRVDALSYAVLSAALSADVRQVHVIEGNEVKVGQLLVTLDDRDVTLELARREADVAQAEAAIAAEKSRHRANLQALPSEERLYELAQQEVARLNDLIKKKLTSQSSLDSARQSAARQAIAISRIKESVRSHQSKMMELEARLESAKASLQESRLKLERARVMAPFDGRITKVQVSKGHRVNQGNPLLELFDNDSLVFRAMLPDRYLPAVRRALARGEALEVSGEVDGQQIQGELVSLGAEVQAQSGAVEGLFRIRSSSQLLQKGRVLRLRLELPELQQVMPVPFEALYGADKVYLVDKEQRLRPVTVERLGKLWLDDKVRLLVRSKQLKPGEYLLTTQLPNAVEGLLVRVIDRG